MKRSRHFFLRFVGLALTLLLSTFAAPAQSEKYPPIAAIKTTDGYFLVMNAANGSFGINITGKEVKALQNAIPMFMIDGKLLQVNIAEIKNFVDTKNSSTKKDILLKHKVWESDYLGQQMGGKLTVSDEPLTIAGDDVLFWNFTRPSAKGAYDRDCFMTRTFGENVLVLSSPIKPGEPIADYKAFLSKIMEGVKISEKPLDVLKLAEEYKKTVSERKPLR